MNREYDFIAIDEGKQNLLRARTGTEEVLWLRSLEEYPTARALERIDDKRILMGYDRGYAIVDIRNGDILHDCRKWKSVTSASMGPDGSVLITGMNLEGLEGVTMVTLDGEDNAVEAISSPGDYVRLMTRTGNGTYLFSTNDHIQICTKKMEKISILKAEGFLHAWKSLVLEDCILVSAGYGAFIARFSPDGKLLQTFGENGTVPREVEPYFYAGFCQSSDSTLLVANWQGHGPDNGKKGKQLLHFDKEGNFLNSWSFPETVSSLQGLLLL